MTHLMCQVTAITNIPVQCVGQWSRRSDRPAAAKHPEPQPQPTYTLRSETVFQHQTGSVRLASRLFKTRIWLLQSTAKRASSLRPGAKPNPPNFRFTPGLKMANPIPCPSFDDFHSFQDEVFDAHPERQEPSSQSRLQKRRSIHDFLALGFEDPIPEEPEAPPSPKPIRDESRYKYLSVDLLEAAQAIQWPPPPLNPSPTPPNIHRSSPSDSSTDSTASARSRAKSIIRSETPSPPSSTPTTSPPARRKSGNPPLPWLRRVSASLRRRASLSKSPGTSLT